MEKELAKLRNRLLARSIILPFLGLACFALFVLAWYFVFAILLYNRIWDLNSVARLTLSFAILFLSPFIPLLIFFSAYELSLNSVRRKLLKILGEKAGLEFALGLSKKDPLYKELKAMGVEKPRKTVIWKEILPNAVVFLASDLRTGTYVVLASKVPLGVAPLDAEIRFSSSRKEARAYLSVDYFYAYLWNPKAATFDMALGQVKSARAFLDSLVSQ